MSDASLETRMENLERTVARIEEWVRSAVELKSSKPALAMVEAGKVAEAICQWVLAERSPDSPVDQRNLAKKAQPFLPLDVNNHILTIQSYRNSGAHSQGPDYEATPGEVETCFLALTHATRWFFATYKPGAASPAIASKMQSSNVILLRIGYQPESILNTPSDLGAAAVEHWLDTGEAPRFKLESGEIAAWDKLLAGHDGSGKTDEVKSRERIAAKTQCKEIAESFETFQAASDLFFGQDRLAYVRDLKQPDHVGTFLAGLARKTMLRITQEDRRRHFDVYSRKPLNFRIRVTQEEQSRMLEAFCVPSAEVTRSGFSCLLGDVPTDIMLGEVLPAWILRYLRCQETLEWKRKNEGYNGPDGLDDFFDVSAWFVGQA